MPNVKIASFAAIVQQACEKESVVFVSIGFERRDDIKPVALIGGVHRVEESRLVGGKPVAQARSLG